MYIARISYSLHSGREALAFIITSAEIFGPQFASPLPLISMHSGGKRPIDIKLCAPREISLPRSVGGGNVTECSAGNGTHAFRVETSSVRVRKKGERREPPGDTSRRGSDDLAPEVIAQRPQLWGHVRGFFRESLDRRAPSPG